MTNGTNLQRKKKTVAFYVLVFCVALPTAVVFSSVGLDAWFRFQTSRAFNIGGHLAVCLLIIVCSISRYLREKR